MKTLIHHIVLSSLIALALISCGEENDSNPSTIYKPINAEINEPITWHATDSVVIDCILSVNSTVTIEAGCTVTFTGNGYMKVGERRNGAIIANGTAQKPIRFTYRRTNLTSVIQKGSWYGIYFGQRNLFNTTKLRYCIIEGAGKDNTPCIELDKTTLFLESSSIYSCAGIGIKATGESSGFSSFQGNTLSECGSYLLQGTAEALNNLDDDNTLTPTDNKGIALLGGNITLDCTLTKQALPYTVLGSLYVDDAQLTIKSGCTLEFTNGTSLNIGKEHPASLIALGKATEPILFTSAATNPQPGDWQGLMFHANNLSSLTLIKYAIIDYAGQTVNNIQGAINTSTQLRMENSLIRNSYTYGLYCNTGVTISGFKWDTIQACNKYPVSIDVKKAHTLDSTTVYTNQSDSYKYINLRGDEFSGDVRWPKQNIPYLLTENLIISNPTEQAKLTLGAGCTIALVKSIVVDENGCLIAEGTALDSITFTSSSDTPESGDWASIEFTPTCSTGNKLSRCIVEYGGGYNGYQLGINTSNVTITRSSIRNSSNYGIFVYYNDPAYTPTLSSNSFSGNVGDNTYYEPQPEP